jgi:hypothetical protein
MMRIEDTFGVHFTNAQLGGLRTLENWGAFSSSAPHNFICMLDRVDTCQ